MAATRTTRLGDRAVTVRELTVTEVRDRLAGGAGAAFDAFRALAFEGYGLDDLAYMADITGVELESIPLSEIAAHLVPLCREMNPFFFRMRTLLAQAEQQITLELKPQTSSAPPASWLSAVTRAFGRIRSAFS